MLGGMNDGEEKEDEESWAQTLITVTPEDDAAIRTISGRALISAPGDTPLALSIDEIADRRRVHFNAVRRDLADDELEKKTGYNDAESQTFLQGVPQVALPPISFKDEITQTIYLQGSQRPLQDIARIMNERPMPSAEKITVAMQTALTFDSTTSKDVVIEGLKDWILAGDQETISTTVSNSTIVRDGLYFVLERVFWLTDPGYHVPEIELREEEVQTYVKFDIGQGKIVLDADVQTILSCEPKRSNGGLLSDWNLATEFAVELIEECIEIGIVPRIVVESFVDEIVDRCASEIHPPSKDEAVQTLAACNGIEDCDEEMLRKLRLEIVVDTLESSIVVLPIVEILLENCCLIIHKNAELFSEDILAKIFNKSVSMAVKIAAIRQEALLIQSHKPMEQIFETRKRKLKESLEQRKTRAKLNSGTQTGLAGVPDIAKVKEPRETVCSICTRHSECYACAGSLEDESQDLITPKPASQGIQGKILGTRDILIAYNPCYVVATPSEIATRLLQPPTTSKPPPSIPSKIEPLPLSTSSSASGRLYDVVGVKTAGQKSVRRRTEIVAGSLPGAASNSLDDWAKVAREASFSFDAWSARGSYSSAVGEPNGSSSTCPNSKKLLTEDQRLPIRSVNALRILKNTFNRCDRGSCSDCSTRNEEIDEEEEEEEEEEKEVEELRSKMKRVSEERESRVKTRGKEEMKKKFLQQLKQDENIEGFSVIPIIYLPNQKDES